MLHFKEFGRYEIICKLGRGMTDVYLALDPTENRRAVLKIIEQSSDPWTQIVLEAERRGTLIQKQLHEADARFLEIYDAGELNGCYFVAMQYVEGKSVAEILHDEKRIDPLLAARYAMEVGNQLARLHSFEIEIDARQRAVVHGDIKPSNIQIGPDGAVRLLDFGIAKAITFTHGLTHHNLGSPSYCSPERLAAGSGGPAFGPLGAGRDFIRNGGGISALPGAEHAEAGRADSLKAASARATRGVSGAVEGRDPESSRGRHREPLSHRRLRSRTISASSWMASRPSRRRRSNRRGKFMRPWKRTVAIVANRGRIFETSRHGPRS